MTVETEKLGSELSPNNGGEADNNRESVGKYGYDDCYNCYPAERGSYIIAHTAARLADLYFTFRQTLREVVYAVQF